MTDTATKSGSQTITSGPEDPRVPVPGWRKCNSSMYGVGVLAEAGRDEDGPQQGDGRPGEAPAEREDGDTTEQPARDVERDPRPEDETPPRDPQRTSPPENLVRSYFGAPSGGRRRSDTRGSYAAALGAVRNAMSDSVAR